MACRFGISILFRELRRGCLSFQATLGRLPLPILIADLLADDTLVGSPYWQYSSLGIKGFHILSSLVHNKNGATKTNISLSIHAQLTLQTGHRLGLDNIFRFA